MYKQNPGEETNSIQNLTLYSIVESSLGACLMEGRIYLEIQKHVPQIKAFHRNSKR